MATIGRRTLAGLPTRTPMSTAVDQTTELLERLEQELSSRQATVDERLAREKAEVDDLTWLETDLRQSLERSDTEFPVLTQERDALTAQRDAWERTNAQGNKARAA